MTCASLLLLVGAVCLAQLCHANEIHISPQDAPTLGSIVDQAQDGDVLVFANGHYPISDRYGIWIKKHLTITAQTPGRVVIDGQGKCRGFQVTSDEVHLIGLNITNCGYSDDHGICTAGAGAEVAHQGEVDHKYVATVTDCNIYGNKGENGGGMEFQSHGGTLEVMIIALTFSTILAAEWVEVYTYLVVVGTSRAWSLPQSLTAASSATKSTAPLVLEVGSTLPRRQT